MSQAQGSENDDHRPEFALHAVGVFKFCLSTVYGPYSTQSKTEWKPLFS